MTILFPNTFLLIFSSSFCVLNRKLGLHFYKVCYTYVDKSQFTHAFGGFSWHANLFWICLEYCQKWIIGHILTLLFSGLLRCGKSCRLRWTNYLRPDIKRGSFTLEEEKLIIQLHGILGNRYLMLTKSDTKITPLTLSAFRLNWLS